MTFKLCKVAKSSNHSTISAPTFQSLTATDNVELGVYADAFDYAFSVPEIRNIGVTGPYGAGKSSVFLTYATKYKKNFMYVSLANFGLPQCDQKAAGHISELEGKILNQLLHQIDVKYIPDTKFRVKHKPSSWMWIHSVLGVLTALLMAHLFQFPEWVALVSSLDENGWVFKSLAWSIKPEARILIILTLCFTLGSIVLLSVRWLLNRVFIKGISIGGHTIEIMEDSDQSYFDRYLNEVLYIFRKCKVDGIVFEDIDRRSQAQHEIFQRLREMNYLANAVGYRKKRRPVRFFYAVRDSIFGSGDRTKFFDFIIPIVPIVDGSNAYDKLVQLFQASGEADLFDPAFLRGISFFIDDMRILKNVYNEFCVYKRRIANEISLDNNKLLAMVTYKNLIPSDHELLLQGKGLVYEILEKRDGLIAMEQKRLSNEIDTIRTTIESSAATEEVSALTMKLEDLESARTRLRHQKLHQLITEENLNTIFSAERRGGIGEPRQASLLTYLVRNGFIDETYQDYLTYFYEGHLTKRDKDFMISLLDEKALDYTYRLDNPGNLVEMAEHHFDKTAILNFDLVDHLLMHGATGLMERIVNVLRTSKGFDFIAGYLDVGVHVGGLIHVLNHSWPGAFQMIDAIGDWDDRYKSRFILASFYHSSDDDLQIMNTSNTVSKFVSGYGRFLDIDDPDVDRLASVFRLLGIKFLDIDPENVNEQLLVKVYELNMYKISLKLVDLMLRHMYHCTDADDIEGRRYTLVISDSSQPLFTYVEDNINEFVQALVASTKGGIADSVDAVARLLSKDDLDQGLKAAYVASLVTKLPRLSFVTDKSVWQGLIRRNCVEFAPDNVLDYFFHNRSTFDEDIANYININAEPADCVFDYDAIEGRFGTGSGKRFLEGTVLCSSLELSRYQEILQSLGRPVEYFNHVEVPPDRMDILISQRIIPMEPRTMELMRNHYQQEVGKFIIRNIKQYVELVNDGYFQFDEMLKVLDSDVSDEYKLSLLEHTRDPLTVSGKNYSPAVKVHILRNNINLDDLSELFDGFGSHQLELRQTIADISIQHIAHILEHEYAVPYTLCLALFKSPEVERDFKKQVLSTNLVNFTEEQFREALEILDWHALSTVFDGKRPLVERNDLNDRILHEMKKRGWIKSYPPASHRNDMYRVFGGSRRQALTEET